MNLPVNELYVKSLLEDDDLSYNQEAVYAIENNLENLNLEMNRIKDSIKGSEIPESVSINYILLTFYRNRCRRILRAYQLRRILNDKYIKNDKEKKTHKRIKEIENEYLSNFNFNYEGTVPLFSYIKIITLKDCGLVYDGEELIDLKEGRIYFIKRKSIEHLLEGGYIEKAE